MKLWKDDGNKGSVRCLLCPRLCLIAPGERGICGVRENRNGEIILVTSGLLSALALDPIEKKPLYHFFPGSSILSAGSYGCNMRCDYCQNYHISQSIIENASHRVSPEQLVGKALTISGNRGIAYTYNEPIIWYEYVMECSQLAAVKGVKNVMITNGFIMKSPMQSLTEVIDAFNIDLKAFSNKFYSRYTGASLKPVLETIGRVAASGRHLEITTLIIPGLNDSEEEMRAEAEWIAANAGRSVPLHLSRYFPMYRRDNPATPPETILRLKEVAEEHLDYVYTGNMSGSNTGGNTLCPGCHHTVITRSGYVIDTSGMTADGRCNNCGTVIIDEANI